MVDSYDVFVFYSVYNYNKIIISKQNIWFVD